MKVDALITGANFNYEEQSIQLDVEIQGQTVDGEYLSAYELVRYVSLNGVINIDLKREEDA